MNSRANQNDINLFSRDMIHTNNCTSNFNLEYISQTLIDGQCCYYNPMNAYIYDTVVAVVVVECACAMSLSSSPAGTELLTDGFRYDAVLVTGEIVFKAVTVHLSLILYGL